MTIKSINPLYDRLLLKRIEGEQTTVGGIIIPDTAKEKTQYGEVISAGPGKLSTDGTIRQLQVQAGDKVLFGKYAGTEVKLDGEDYLIIKEEEILGIINK